MWAFKNGCNIQTFGLVRNRDQRSALVRRDVCGNWNGIRLSDWIDQTKAC